MYYGWRHVATCPVYLTNHDCVGGSSGLGPEPLAPTRQKGSMSESMPLHNTCEKVPESMTHEAGTRLNTLQAYGAVEDHWQLR